MTYTQERVRPFFFHAAECLSSPFSRDESSRGKPTETLSSAILFDNETKKRTVVFIAITWSICLNVLTDVCEYIEMHRKIHLLVEDRMLIQSG